MKHAIVLGFLASFLAAIGCAPDAEPPTTTCNSITECAIGKACDQTTHTCIKEPDNRFLGRFHCKVSATDTGELQLSEVVGKADNERYALTNAICAFHGDQNEVTILLSDLDGGESMHLIVKAGLNGRVPIGAAISKTDESEDPFVTISNDFRFTREATSLSGFLTLSTPLVEGAELEGYVDFTVAIPPRHLEALLGEPCRNGLADCGTAMGSVGGASTCILNTVNPKAVPVCAKSCTANGDCALGKGVCNNGLCVRACTTDAECTDLGQRCFEAASSQESPGCHNAKP